VIALEDQRIAARQARLDVRRRRPDVGEDAQAARAVADHVLDGLARIVGNRDGLDLERADGEALVAVEAVDALHALEALADDSERSERRPDGNAVFGRERGNAADVVGVLVGDEYRVERRRRKTQPGEAPLRVANAEPAIDQDPGAPRVDDEAIAFAAAAQ
jgi:hypothetical protein